MFKVGIEMLDRQIRQPLKRTKRHKITNTINNRLNRTQRMMRLNLSTIKIPSVENIAVNRSILKQLFKGREIFTQCI